MKKYETKRYLKQKKFKNVFLSEDKNYLIEIKRNKKVPCKCFPKTIIFIITSFILLALFFINRMLRKYNYINIAYSVDNIYHYIAHVSMKSIMLSQKPTTFINFYILCSNITDEQKQVINRISSQHKNCKIEYIDVGDQFKEFKIPKHKSVLWTTATFNRMLLPILFPKEKKNVIS